MKILIVTVAGMSSRFSESLGYPCLKCLYNEGGFEESLLYRLVNQPYRFDLYVIVGGFRYEELVRAVRENFKELKDRILLVENRHYAEYGSGYSLYAGLERIRDMEFDEVVFAEGDLFVDGESFQKVCNAPGSVITCSREAILAEKAVVFYTDQAYGIHYLYDTEHRFLEVREPFRGMFHSGQIWKFADRERLYKAVSSIRREEWQGTNLVLVQKYFEMLRREEYEIITFRDWINCNTVSDYRKMKEGGGK